MAATFQGLGAATALSLSGSFDSKRFRLVSRRSLSGASFGGFGQNPFEVPRRNFGGFLISSISSSPLLPFCGFCSCRVKEYRQSVLSLIIAIIAFLCCFAPWTLHNIIYVASTTGRITALSIKASPFYVLWQCDLGVPVFGSLSICPISGNVICCLVDGSVLAFDKSGSIIWKTATDGPIFAGACISSVLPSQVLICCRSGKIYSINTERGNVIWEYDVGEPLTASAYVDENLQLISDRLVCVCTCSGSIVVLRVNAEMEGNQLK